LTLLVAWQEGHPACRKPSDAGMVLCLGQGAELHIAQLNAVAAHFLLLQIQIGFTFMVLPFWCRLTWMVLDKVQEGRKMIVCVCVCVRACMC